MTLGGASKIDKDDKLHHTVMGLKTNRIQSLHYTCVGFSAQQIDKIPMGVWAALEFFLYTRFEE